MKNLLFILIFAFPTLSNAQASDTSRAKLHHLIDSVVLADVYQYDTKDNFNNSMDAAQILPNPNGGFMSVYHHYINGQPQVFLAISSDFLTWTVVDTVALNASQPTFSIASDGGYVMAWEQEPSNHIKIVYYSTLSNMFNGIVTNTYDVTRTLSTCAEGTPNIYEASSTFIDIGFHYYENCLVDRQARGTLTNFNNWTASTVPSFDNSLLFWNVLGNIGDREHFFYDNYDFALIEGQFIMNDFGSFRAFIYDYQTGNAEQLQIITHNGSTAFANPTITFMQINQRPAMVVALFMPFEGAATGETGELIYYRYLDNDITTHVSTHNNEKLTIAIHPNPAISILTINSTEKIKYISIYNLNGQLVNNYDIINTEKHIINIANLQQGIYLLKVRTDNNINNIKFIKE